MAQPTMQQVAHRAGVSLALVSLVMRGAPNVSDRRRKLVLDAAEQLEYRPNVLARNLASLRTQTIGVVLNDLHNPFFAEAIDGIQVAADAHDHRVLIGNGGRSEHVERAAIETLLQFRVDGLILVGPEVGDQVIEAAARSAAVVAVGRTTESTLVDTVNNDEAVGSRLAVEHLAHLGHRRIAHIGGGNGAGAWARQRGYEEAMIALGLEEHILIAPGDFTEAGGYAAAGDLLDALDPPTAIFAANDLSAAGALGKLEDAGLRVPADISLVGYDNTSLAAMPHMSMTTIDQPRSLMGQTAVETLIERVNGSRSQAVHHVIAPTLVERSSSAHPPSTPSIEQNVPPS